MKKRHFIILFLTTFLLSACGNATTSDQPTIITTFYPVYEFTQQIVGNEAEVKLLIKSGTEVHDFDPSAKDIANIEEADSFIYANDNMETWVSDLKTNLDESNSKVNLISATKGMLLLPGSEENHEEEEEEHEHEHGYDPHVWVSPYRAIMMVESLRDSLIAQYPDKKERFTENASAYISKLKELDQTYKETLSQAKQKSFVTQHKAFTYLALDYGLEQVSVSGLNSDSEPSATRLAELTKYIKDNKINYIYFEETVSSAVAETLAAETGVKTAVLNPLESLTSQAMEAGEDYISTMESNLKALQLTTNTEGSTISSEEEEVSLKTVYNGYFEDSAVKDRPLKDWQGEWQSIYPYLRDGSFDQIWDYKSKAKGASMTADQYKDYYDKGYQTSIDQITITDDTITFSVDGSQKKYTYTYVGYKVLTYEKGNRGVRYLFEATEADAGPYRYVQFSDHSIAPNQADHFHIYIGGDSHDSLLTELENWPTYYPTGLTGLEIGQEILAH